MPTVYKQGKAIYFTKKEYTAKFVDSGRLTRLDTNNYPEFKGHKYIRFKHMSASDITYKRQGVAPKQLYYQTGL